MVLARGKSTITCLLSFWMLMMMVTATNAQYFGRNKPHYRTFDFEVYKSPNFEIYHYLDEDSLLNDYAQECEHWYEMHQEVFHDTFTRKNPMIFYNNHADFQQTKAISGSIGVGTGGVTEGLKNRVVMPFMESREQTSHVLGHELVHAFQYHLLIEGDSTSINNMRNLPLWMVEGLAEYMSIGQIDAHTAMWMRDAVLNEDIPSLRDLSVNPNYFPYRYGQAFWAFLAGTYGDKVITPYFKGTAMVGLEEATSQLLGMNYKELSKRWQKAQEEYYKPMMAGNNKKPIGKQLFEDKNIGKTTISPSISPNGKYLTFLSEKNIFSIDLFVAEAKTGKILGKVASTVTDGHIDAFSYLESAGSWSPDSERFAFVVFKKGINRLLIKEVLSGKTKEEIVIPGVPSFTNPAWSPDGKNIVVTGLVNGHSDLYMYNLESKEVIRLTNDYYSDLQANWSRDGKQIVFATDRISTEEGKTHGKLKFNLAILDVATKEVKNIPIFKGSDNMNPQFTGGEEPSIIFLSNRDGFRNLYRYDLSSEKVFQLTDFFTGISGVTFYSPAITISKRNTVIYSHYLKQGYTLYKTRLSSFKEEEVDPTDIDYKAAILPPLKAKTTKIVATNLEEFGEMAEMPADSFSSDRYRPKFKLDYIGGSTGAAVGTGGFGTAAGLAGGIETLFSDILGNNQLYGGLALNGTIYDFAGQLNYLNQKRRIAWGVGFSHIPYTSAFSNYAGVDTLFSQQGYILADKLEYNIQRTFEDRLSVFSFYPISQIKRIELGGSVAMYNQRIDRYNNYYYFNDLIYQDRERIGGNGQGFWVETLNAAFVSDNSFFGITSPLQGHRYRVGVEKYFGGLNMHTFLLDFRKYWYFRPLNVSLRGMHYSRFGQDGNNLYPLFVGNPIWIRGYNPNSFRQRTILAANDVSINQLIGSKMAIGNFELRLPFTGPKRLALIKSRFLLTEFALFMDGGVAWFDLEDFKLEDGYTNGFAVRPKPVFSTGASLRINVLGALVIEPYYAIPLQKRTTGSFGFNILPGW